MHLERKIPDGFKSARYSIRVVTTYNFPEFKIESLDFRDLSSAFSHAVKMERSHEKLHQILEVNENGDTLEIVTF